MECALGRAGRATLLEFSPRPSVLAHQLGRARAAPAVCPGPPSSLPTPEAYHLRHTLPWAIPPGSPWVLPQRTGLLGSPTQCFSLAGPFPSCVRMNKWLTFSEHPSCLRNGLHYSLHKVTVRTEILHPINIHREPATLGSWGAPVAKKISEIPDLVGWLFYWADTQQHPA